MIFSNRTRLIMLFGLLIAFSSFEYAYAESRPEFNCTVKPMTPGQHWYVACENESYRGHITALNQIDNGKRYWSGFVYRIETRRLSDPFVNIVIRSTASADGVNPPANIHCIWASEEMLLTNCKAGLTGE